MITTTTSQPNPWAWAVVPSFLATAIYVVAFGWAMEHTSYDIWGAFLIAPVLVAVTVPLLIRAGRQEGDPWQVRLLVAALVCKMLGSIVRYIVTFEVFGAADATGYHGAGRRLARAFWGTNFWETYNEEVPTLVGTEFIRLVTGVLYIVTGPTKLGGFVVYTWFSFWGLYFFYRAFVIAVPDGDRRRYGLFVFFLPSLLYWPSSIGKEAWMTFVLGLATYGAARILSHARGGAMLFALGLIGTGMVRPHVTLVVFVAFFLSYFLRSGSGRSYGLLRKLVGLVVLVAVGAVVIGRVAEFFHLESFDRDGVEQALTRTESQSATGGSEFEATRPSSPVEFPAAVMTVLLRPFPWEAHNVSALIAALEGAVLGVAMALSVRRLLAAPLRMLQNAYVTFVVAYSLMFMYAFSAVGNFGIITRQRVQVLPYVLVLLALRPLGQEDRGEVSALLPPALNGREELKASWSRR